MIFFVCNGLPTFVSIDRGQVGPRNQRLTAVFRDETITPPHCLWVLDTPPFLQRNSVLSGYRRGGSVAMIDRTSGPGESEP